MQKGMIIACPDHDDATAYLAYFSQNIIAEAVNKSLKIKMVQNKELNLSSFSEIICKLDYRLIVINGHGSPESIFGYKTEAIIEVGKNDSLLKERLVYARSCHAGAKLGPECMKNTTEGCFIGYNFPFIFYMDSRWTTSPHNDKVAELFLEPSNLVPISLIKGHSTGEAHINSKRQMLKRMVHLFENVHEQETPFYLEALWNNYIGQVLIGNGSAAL